MRLLVSEAWRSLLANASTTLAAIVTVLVGMFILGFVQGIVRRVIGIVSMLFALVFAVALGLMLVIGNFLNTNLAELRERWRNALLNPTS